VIPVRIPPSPEIRLLVAKHQEGPSIQFGAIGVNSYLRNSKIDVIDSGNVCNLQVGNYSSIGRNINLFFNRNHDIKAITTSPHIKTGGRDNYKIQQKGQILIGHDVWLGKDVTIIADVKIGNGAVVGTRAVVAKDIPPYAVVVGNPAKVVKYRFHDDQVEKLLKIKWWNWDADTIERRQHYFSYDLDRFIDRFYDEPQSGPAIAPIPLEVKSKVILIVSDDDYPSPVIDKVILEYLDRFRADDDITLLIKTDCPETTESLISKYRETVSAHPGCPHIHFINTGAHQEKNLFKQIDYFVATRSRDTMRYIDYADEFGVNILAGVNIPVFGEINW
jgi:virginiamycin A acetyltransferase